MKDALSSARLVGLIALQDVPQGMLVTGPLQTAGARAEERTETWWSQGSEDGPQSMD